MPDPISWSYAWPYLTAALIGGYLIGSIPFGLVLTRLSGLGDIRSVGSGNIGATNVLRTGRKDLAALTLLLDAGKGAVAVVIAQGWGGPDAALMAALGSVLGHLYPVWLRFRGGKGVATTLGIFLVLNFYLGVAACGTWLVTALLFRFSSLASLAAMASTPFFAWLIAGDRQLVELSAVIALLVCLRHHQNIRRLVKGEEPRISRKKET